MKVVYIAGPYRAAHGKTVIENVRAAEKVAMKWWKEGHAVFCPHKNSEFFDGIAPDKSFLNGDLEILKRCDAIVMIKNWAKSSGAVAELKLARNLGLEIHFEDPDDFVPAGL